MEAKFVFDNAKKELSSGGENRSSPIGGLGRYMFDHIKKHAESDSIAQIEGETGMQETYQVFFSKCVKLALFMRDQGLQPGDIISMCSQNTMNNSAVFIASLFTGLVTASTDPLISVEDTKYLLDMVKPKMIFVCENSTDLITKALGENNTRIIALYKHKSLIDLPGIFELYNDDDIKSFVPVHIDNTRTTACIMFSSGTTGLPKGTCLSHDHLYADMAAPLASNGSILCGFTTLYWYSGVYFSLTTFSKGMIKLNYRQFSAENIWNDLNKHKVNILYMSYAHTMDSVQHLKIPMPHLKCLLIVGGMIAVKYHKEFKTKLPHLLVGGGYGMTEIGYVTKNDGRCSPESVGLLAAKNLILRVVDPDLETPLDLNTVGEIRVKSKNQMNGYYNQDSKDCWDADGFFKTGDLGYLDDKYQVYIVDRIKEMFKYRSWHVLPAKIEKVLREHPAVLHGIVIGVPTKDHENHAMGFVVLRDGFSVSSEELVKFVNNKVDDIHQLRAGVKFITENEIPFTVTGKISRLKLKQMYSE